MAYEFYFDKVLLPVAPSKMKTEIKSKNSVVNLINESEINILKDSGLTKITFTFLLPSVNYPFARYLNGFKNPVYYLDMLENYKKKKEPFQFIVARVTPNRKVLFYTNMKMSLENYEISDDVNLGTDVEVKVTLLQYKAYGTKTVDVSQYIRKITTQTTRSAGTKASTSGTKYIIKSGDTLWNIAKKKLGNGAKWKDIYNANKTVIENAAKKRGRASSSNGHWIYPNTEIIIPSSTSTTTKNTTPVKNTTKTYGVLMAGNYTVAAGLKTFSDAYSFYLKKNGEKNNYKIVVDGTTKNLLEGSFKVTTSSNSVIASGFNNFNKAYAFYVSTGGKTSKWKIIESATNVVFMG